MWNHPRVPGYEYATVVYLLSTNLDESSEPNFKQTWTEAYWIYMPEAEPESREGEGVSILTVANELGRVGWRWLESVVMDTASAGGHRYGWLEYAMPIRVRYVFERELS